MPSLKEKTTFYGQAMGILAIVMLSGYFIYAAVQGDFGLFKRFEILALEKELRLQIEEQEEILATLKNKTTRMSDGFLDLDLLDEQARNILGYVRPDEIIIKD